MNFIKYEFENIATDICSFLNIKYDKNNEYKNLIDELISEYVMPRLVIFDSQANFYIVEEGYVETAWKDMISLHYINTSYSIKPTVTRIHLFTDKKLCSEAYLGYFSLRPINEFKILISYIYPNWDVLRFTNKTESFVMLYKEKVHIEGVELEISTFPFFAQDGVVASCVHADIIMLSLYLHKKFGSKKIKLMEIENSYTYEKKKCYPTNGLQAPQIAEIFNNNKTPIRLYFYHDKNIIDNFKEILKMYIESGIPVIIGLGSHVLLIIGHTLDAHGNYEFIVYDDSGILVNELNETKSFVSAISWERLNEKLEDFDFLVAPEHEKVFMSYIDINDFFEIQKKKAAKNEEVNIKFSDTNRILLIDNSDVKKYLKLKEFFHFNRSFVEESTLIIKKNLPHYLWYCETRMNGVNVSFFGDPTYHYKSTDTVFLNNNVFLNKNPFFLKKQIGLLNQLKN